MALTCTPGGASDNSYVTLAQADAYYDDTLRSAAWEAFGDMTKSTALIQATADIERLGGAKADDLSPARALFVGSPYATTEDSGGTIITSQALHFPRTSDVDANGAVFIPQALRDAVCEQALWLLEQDANPPLLDRAALQAAGITSVSVDGLSESYRATGVPRGIAPRAWMLVRQYIIQTAKMVY